MQESLIAHIRSNDDEFQPLVVHLSESSTFAGKAAAEIGLQKTGEILGLVHDMGKASNEFQKYILSANGKIDPDSDDYVNAGEQKGKIDHSSAGAQYIYRLMSQRGKQGDIVGQMLALCLASHHSGLIDCLSPDGVDVLHNRIEKKVEFTHLDEALALLQTFLDSHIDESSLLEVETQIINKINSIIEKDENGKPIDSRETFTFKNGLLIRYLFSCLIDADRLSTAEFESPGEKKLRSHGKYADWGILSQTLENHLSALEKSKESSLINDVRNQISETCLNFSSHSKGIFQLNVPTGGGKTLSSLRFALNHARIHNMSHVFYIVPYTSIIDQNAQRVREILEERDKAGKFLDKVILEHHSNLTPEEESKRHNLLAQNWDAPIIFTTQVKFLETFWGTGTRDVRRLHQLANSVIIFDEIQTLPIRCIQMFNLAVRFLVHSCGCSVVMCTATQPLLDRITPAERALPVSSQNKMIAHEGELFRKLKRVNVVDRRKSDGWTESEIAQLALDQLPQKGSVLIVVNTKDSAHFLFLELIQRTEVPVYHLSTSMCPAHRLEVLDKVRKKLDAKEPVVCVSTQLIEAGVDIDFGCVIRYMAGLDSIIQAAGRCNREGKQDNPGVVFVVNPSHENLTQLKDIRTGIEKTERVWSEFENHPDLFENDRVGLLAMQKYYQYYFFERNGEMDYPLEKQSLVGRNDNLFSLLSTNVQSYQEYLRGEEKNKPPIQFLQSFASAAKCFSAIDQITRGVVVPYGPSGKELIASLCASEFLEKRIDLIKTAQQYSVNLFQYQFKEMLDEKAISEVQKDAGIYCLDEQYYDARFGWSREIVNTPKFSDYYS